jgi:hypothetical protein
MRKREDAMSLVQLTRPDGSPVAINPDEVVHLAPVPTSGPLMGPLTSGTRIEFRNQSHQDVMELLDVVIAKIDAARAQGLAASTSSPGAARSSSRGPKRPSPVTKGGSRGA